MYKNKQQQQKATQKLIDHNICFEFLIEEDKKCLSKQLK